MQTINIRGLYVNEAAAKLVANAPAKGDYFGIIMRARYATTRPEDVAVQYERTINARTLAYWANVPASMQARMRCTCGRSGCKMWRDYQTFADRTRILCGACALKAQGKVGTVGADGKHEDEHGFRSDSIGWMVPAVPTFDGTFWGYTSVPDEGVRWWRSLPT